MCGVDGQMPPSLGRQGGQSEINRSGAGIEHQAKCVLLVFVDQTGKLFFFRVGPVGQSSLRAKPLYLAIRVELLLTQNRMGTTKGEQIGRASLGKECRSRWSPDH